MSMVKDTLQAICNMKLSDKVLETLVDLNMKLTPAQLSAVLNLDQDLIVSASAGTGKTSTMVARALYLILSGVDVGRITMLTFTEAAAAEMKDRFQKELSKQLKIDKEDLTKSLDALNELTFDDP
ncbi:MAG: UvrD-helicase domain-containing protein, partial [Clostridia bacterium]|nr:UvrD-helicase domain-containing protein [Clostridia bacterium]